jgi:uncharacterized protein YcbK (DUF882 family)
MLVALGAGMTSGASALGETRTLSLYEIHTKESITVTYMRDGKYDEEALKKLNHFMRDWRADKETHMDPSVIDLVWTLHEELGSKEPVHLISGYRSPSTNEKLRRAGGGQAKFSQHTLGKACDIHFPDVSVKTLRASRVSSWPRSSRAAIPITSRATASPSRSQITSWLRQRAS